MKTSLELKKELEQIKEEKEQAYKEWYDATEGMDYNQAIKNPLHKKAWDLNRELEAKTNECKTALNSEVKVGDGITISLYSDAHAYTIIKRTAKTITIQRDKATLKEGWKPEIITGGFAGHCVNNNEQEYDYERNEKGETKVLHWSEKQGNWISKVGHVRLGRHEFYDYNF